MNLIFGQQEKFVATELNPSAGDASVSITTAAIMVESGTGRRMQICPAR